MKKRLKKNSFLQGVFILMISQGLIKIFGLIYTLYLVNREGFGDCGNAIYGSGYQIYAMLLTLSSIGVPNAISRMVSEKLAIGDFKGANRIFKIALLTFSLIGLVGTLILFIGSKYIANTLLQIPEARVTLMTLSPAIFFVAVASVFKGYFNGMENMQITALSQIIEQVSKTILSIMFVELIANISKTSTTSMAAGATIATTCATFFGFLYLFYYYYKCKNKIGNDILHSINYRHERILTIIKNVLKVSIPISLSAIMASLTKNIDSVTVVRGLKHFLTISEAKVEYGILSGKIETLVALPMSLNISFATALVPAISSAKAVKNYNEIRKKINLSMLIGLLIGIPCTIGMNIYAKEILNLLFPNANGGVEILKISSISIVFAILSQTMSGVLQGIGKEFVPAKAFGIGIIVKILCNLILIRIPNIGIKGAAIGTVLCNITSFTISYIEIRKSVNIKLKVVKNIIKPIIASIIMGISSYVLYIIINNVLKEKISFIIALLFSVVIYILFIYFLKIFSKNEIQKLPILKQINKSTESTEK